MTHKERRREILEMRSNGLQFDEIALKVGMENQRVKWNFFEGVRKKETEGCWFHGLEFAAIRWVVREGIPTKAHFEAAFLAGDLQPGVIDFYGPITHKKVADWLGVQINEGCGPVRVADQREIALEWSRMLRDGKVFETTPKLRDALTRFSGSFLERDAKKE